MIAPIPGAMFVTRHPPVNKLIIFDLTNGGFMPLQVNPKEIKDSWGATWEDSEVSGVSHPRQQYARGGPRILRFTAPFYLEYDYTDVRRRCQWLLSLLVPTHAGVMIDRPPAVCALVMGGLLRGFRATLRQADVTYKEVFDPIMLMPLWAEVECVWHEWVERSIGPMEVRSWI